jgi:UPF0716 family protein affecting phage T7 exclusion
VPLSEYEQRVLEQLEHDLGSDPKLGHAMARGEKSRGHLTWAVIGVIAGLAIVLAGAMTQIPLIGVAGFAVMLGAAIWGLTGGKSTSSKKPAAKGPAKSAAPTKAAPRKGFMNRMEDRFERRRDEGDL